MTAEDRQKYEQEIAQGLHVQRKRIATGLRPIGGCCNCGEPLHNGRLFCNDGCQRDFEAQEST